jgi:hypothetical protein
MFDLAEKGQTKHEAPPDAKPRLWAGFLACQNELFSRGSLLFFL